MPLLGMVSPCSGRVYRSLMNPVLLLAIRAVLGGTLVVVFALVGEVVKPKRFAGIFGAGPSVALANLALVAAIEGISTATTESLGMIAGGVAMVGACGVGIWSIRRFRAVRGSVVMGLAWIAIAVVAKAVFYR